MKLQVFAIYEPDKISNHQKVFNMLRNGKNHSIIDKLDMITN